MILSKFNVDLGTKEWHDLLGREEASYQLPKKPKDEIEYFLAALDVSPNKRAEILTLARVLYDFGFLKAIRQSSYAMVPFTIGLTSQRWISLVHWCSLLANMPKWRVCPMTICTDMGVVTLRVSGICFGHVPKLRRFGPSTSHYGKHAAPTLFRGNTY